VGQILKVTNLLLPECSKNNRQKSKFNKSFIAYFTLSFSSDQPQPIAVNQVCIAGLHRQSPVILHDNVHRESYTTCGPHTSVT